MRGGHGDGGSFLCVHTYAIVPTFTCASASKTNLQHRTCSRSPMGIPSTCSCVTRFPPQAPSMNSAAPRASRQYCPGVCLCLCLCMWVWGCGCGWVGVQPHGPPTPLGTQQNTHPTTRPQILSPPKQGQSHHHQKSIKSHAPHTHIHKHNKSITRPTHRCGPPGAQSAPPPSDTPSR